MNLDLYSVLVMTALVVNVSGILFIVETLLRRDEGAGRIWALAFLAAMLTTLAYVIWAQSPEAWWAVAVGNARSSPAPAACGSDAGGSTGAGWGGPRRSSPRRSLAAAVVGVRRGSGRRRLGRRAVDVRPAARLRRRRRGRVPAR